MWQVTSVIPHRKVILKYNYNHCRLRIAVPFVICSWWKTCVSVSALLKILLEIFIPLSFMYRSSTCAHCLWLIHCLAASTSQLSWILINLLVCVCCLAADALARGTETTESRWFWIYERIISEFHVSTSTHEEEKKSSTSRLPFNSVLRIKIN